MRHRARYKNHVWSYEFGTDRTEEDRQLRLLVVIAEYTRECLAIEVGRSFTAQDVIVFWSICSPYAAPPNTLGVTTARSLYRK